MISLGVRIMAENKTQTGRGNDFGIVRRGSPGHPEASSQPIVNQEMTPANVKQRTEVPHPGVRSPHS